MWSMTLEGQGKSRETNRIYMYDVSPVDRRLLFKFIWEQIANP